jgi:Secretion system C-terminal sorting domain
MKKHHIVFGIVLLLAIATQAQLHGIDPAWYQSLPALPKYNSGWEASGAVANNMVVDADGRTLIFYQEKSGAQQKLYVTGSTDDGLSWTQPSPTEFGPSTKTNANSSVSVDMDTTGMIHALWSSRTSRAVYYAHAPASTLIWSDTLRIGTTSKNKIGFAQISTDRKGRLHAYWNESGPGSPQSAEVFYARSLDGGMSWSPQIMLSLNDAHHSAFPSGDFMGAVGDTLAIAWRDSVGMVMGIDQDWDVQMVFSTDGGATWALPITVAGGTGMQSDPSVIVDRHNMIHLAHHYYPAQGGLLAAEVRYANTSDLGTTWSPANFAEISLNGIQSHLVKEAYDFTNDVVWIFYKDQRDYVSPFDKRADIMAVHISNHGATVSAPEFNSDADSSEAGFHNFKVGSDGIPRGHFFIIPYGTTQSTIYYTQRTALPTAIDGTVAGKPHNLQAYPNPSGGRFQIAFEIAGTQRVTCTVRDMAGRVIAIPLQAELSSGIQRQTISLAHLAPGVYCLDLQIGEENEFQKIVIH